MDTKDNDLVIKVVLNHISQEFITKNSDLQHKLFSRTWSRNWPGPWRPWSRPHGGSGIKENAFPQKKRWRYRKEGDDRYIVYDRITGKIYITNYKGLHALLEGE